MRLALLILALAVTPTLAWATVRPPDEFLDTPEQLSQWQAFAPTLLDWEFKPQPPMTGTPLASLDGIQRHLGLSAEQAAQAQSDASGVAGMKLDLNMDGRVDQFDVLELGYQAEPAAKRASIAPASGTNKWIVLRSDFSDVNANYGTYTTSYFNQRLFDNGVTPKPSLHDYYEEVSYGKLNVTGTVDTHGSGGDGWYKGSHTKNWYHQNGGNWLVRESVLAADASVDFSEYDVDHDGYVESLCVYYPGPVVWYGGLHPHRSSGLNIQVDGVIVDSYFLSVVDTGADSWLMAIGAHEYGHILGLPDLYDVDGGSAGVGYWSLMAYQYNNNQKIPSPDPWCKTQLGWVTPTVITDNATGYSLGCYQDSPEVLKVWTDGKQFSQYFLLANYRQKKTDAERPGQGMLLLHIDDTITGGNMDNANEDRKHVDVESARGYADPNLTNPKDPLDDGDNGAAEDLWYSGNMDGSYPGIFDDDSNPFSRDYPNPGSDTFIKLSNISASADTMTLDIQVETAGHPTCEITAPSGGTVSGNVTIDVTATPGTDRTIDRVEFYCNGAYLGQDSGSPYSLTFDSRPVYNGTREIKAVAVDNTGSIDTDTVSVTVSNSAVSIPYSYDFESGIGAWAVYDWHGTRRWEEKSVAYGGAKSAGIGHDTEGYGYDEHDALVSVRFDLTAATHPVARWRQRYRVAGGENTCKVLVSDDGGASFDMLSTRTGSNLSWHPASVDLTAYAGQEVYLLFRLDSSSLNRATGEAGWWIDNFEIHERSSGPSITGITPSDGSTVSGMTAITVSATDDEGVERVDMYIDGELFASDYSAPFTTNWNSDWVFNGARSFSATAYDADLQSDSMTVNWTASNSGLSVPWGENFDTDPGVAWHMINNNGAGWWHRQDTGGYGSGPGMYFGYSTTYDDNENDWYISPTLNLSSITDPGFGWLHKYDIEANYDYARVYVTTDLDSWTQLAVYSATNQGWQAGGYRLDSYLGQKIKLAFFFESDGGLVHDGWWVDELRLDPAPQISSVTPNPVRNSQSITIAGSGFGAGGASDFPRVTISGTQASVVSWSDTSITATVPASAATGDVLVYRHGIASDGYHLHVKLPPPSLGGLDQL